MNEISICNAALSYLGEVGNVVSIDPPDNTPYSESCSIYFYVALKYLLEQHNWSFAMRRLRLPKIEKYDKTLYGWEYGYRVPFNFVRIIGVYSEVFDKHSKSEDFELERLDDSSYILLTDAKNAVLRYVSDEKTNISLLPNYFCQALIVQLASYLTGPLMKTTLADKLNQLAFQALEHAKYLDSRSSFRVTHDYMAPHLKARAI